MALQDIALNKLVLSERNMRKSDVDVSDLVANIGATKKIRQNLNVIPQMKGKKATGLFEVVAGGRRLRAAQALAQAGEVPADWAIPCQVENPDEAEEISLSENYVRLPAHPADIYAAFAKLAEKGLSEKLIAERYNLTDQTRVTRTLRLAKVSPRLFEMFRRDELNFDQMSALTLTEDHELQEQVAISDGQANPAYKIRRLLTEADVPTSDDRVTFVGLDAYRAAGGMVKVDLFSDADGGGYLTDAGLLERLALAKLDAERPAVEAEGWGWVETATSFDYSLSNTFGRIYPKTAPLDPETQAQLDTLQEELEAIYNQELEEGDENESRAITLEEQIERITDAAERASRYEPEKMALAGAYILIGRDGGVQVERGLVRPADKRALAALSDAPASQGAPGGREAAAGPAKPDYSAALVANLTSHRTLALRAELAKRPDVALVAAVHSLLLLTYYRRGGTNSPLVLTGRTWQSPDLFANGEDLPVSSAALTLDALKEEHGTKLPDNPAHLWDHLAQCSQAELLDLLAYATADSLDAVQSPYFPKERGATIDKIAAAVDLDMADHWSATAAGYFSRVSKSQILQAISEGVSPDTAGQLAGLKKGELAAEAEKRLEGRRWLPPLFRAAGGSEPAQQAPDARSDAIEDEGEGDEAGAEAA